MTSLANSFEGGTNGTTLTGGAGGNTGGSSGSFFDTINVGAGTTNAFDNTQAAHGTLSCKMVATTTTSPYCQWSTSIGSATQFWFRLYLYFTVNPAANQRIWAAIQTATTCAALQLLTTGQLRFLNAAGGTVFTTTATIPLNQWFRVEGFVIGDPSVGQVELKLFKSLDSITPNEVDTSAANLNTTGQPNTARFGESTTPASNLSAFWMDDAGLSTTGYLGPVMGTAPGQPPQITRRTPGRAVWARTAIPGANAAPVALGAANAYPHLTVARRYPARGWFNAAAGPGNAVPGAQLWVPKPLVSRRTPARGLWRGTVTATTNLLNGSQPGSGLVRRRTAARAAWRGMVISTVNPPAVSGTAQPRAAIPVPRRAAARAMWHGTVTYTVNAHGAAAPAPGQQPRISRRTASRAYWHGTPVSVTYPPPPRTVRLISGVPYLRWTTGSPVLG